ncbi:hypothetical protein H5410_007477 [Solanum commersonii]|uniref:Uncharacterized protein n=1 Tax=Solanum commersonii TaxID=4109 RepID=A0A9J6AD58_SOLCO|nr:hypothetical protein H5410_007477 [Solanum commersonii]
MSLCKKYFQDYNKCDFVDNNMIENFNAWILPAKYKTIITMLEEIRVKMMKRIGDLREFSNTWITDISPMSLKILQENIEKFMQCNLTWNGERGFEIKHHRFTHTMDLLVGVVVGDPDSSVVFLVLVVLLPFITRSWNQFIMWPVIIEMKPTSARMPILFSQ